MTRLTEKTLKKIYLQAGESPKNALKLIKAYIKEEVRKEVKKVMGQTMEVGVFKNHQHIKTFEEIDEAEEWLEKKLGSNLQRYSENYFFDKETNDTYKLTYISTTEPSPYPSPIDARIGDI